MSADIMQINAKWLFDFIVPLIGVLILFSLGYKIFRYEDEEMSISEIMVNMIKMTAYGFLAVYIYLKVLYSSATQLDVLTFFTFILASLEATHCFINSIGTYLVNLIRLWRD
ncbi:hypothetical protein J1907_03105 [Lysinibacillus sphaericus]|uniref:hypothetical protein n=1 Tax=Lysinibacillus sphaericus TaxID=1421 RepID=UPI00056384AB|nr:hypothetical protein [Lysinibacillus sphaericus]QTB23117.1 hypothetical protein J1907_03105 [Lysinibacillus sphaericus]